MSLSAFQIACVTSGVPATGDYELDKIIRAGTKFRAAVEILAARQREFSNINQYDVDKAIEIAESLMTSFGKNINNEEKK